MTCVDYKENRKASNGCLQSMGIKFQGVHIVLSSPLFAGDTMEHNKLCSLRGGTGLHFLVTCVTTNMHLNGAANVPNSKLTINSKMKELCEVHWLLCMPYKHFIWSWLLWSWWFEWLIVTGHFAYHAILLGNVTRLVNSFVRLKKGKC